MANLTVKGKVYEIVPDLNLTDSPLLDSCWECDLAKQCQPLNMFCKDYSYNVHFKLMKNDSK